jgi:C4-type Zn-finger protein
MNNDFKKFSTDICPVCGHRNHQIVQGKYPEYSYIDDVVTKFFLCEKCNTEYYERFELRYAGCKAMEAVEDGYQLVIYDEDGNKKN